ncbi:MAG TPA: hypothetical protein VFU19_08790 [Iamia sp.]|nr:hypothetical protein [Iamia sp.]
MRGFTRTAVGVALGAALLLGCGGDDDGAADDDGATTTAAETGTTDDEATTTDAPTTSTTTTEPPTTTTSTTAPPGTTPPTTGTTAWRDLTAGACIGVLPEGTFTDVTVVDCAEPHAAEAVTGLTAVRISGGDADASAQATCDQALAPHAGPGRAASYILETQGTLLARAVCLVVDPSGAPMTGSVLGG